MRLEAMPIKRLNHVEVPLVSETANGEDNGSVARRGYTSAVAFQGKLRALERIGRAEISGGLLTSADAEVFSSRQMGDDGHSTVTDFIIQHEIDYRTQTCNGIVNQLVPIEYVDPIDYSC